MLTASGAEDSRKGRSLLFTGSRAASRRCPSSPRREAGWRRGELGWPRPRSATLTMRDPDVAGGCGCRGVVSGDVEVAQVEGGDELVQVALTRCAAPRAHAGRRREVASPLVLGADGLSPRARPCCTRESMASERCRPASGRCGGEAVDRGRSDHVGQHVGEQLPGHGLAVALGSSEVPAAATTAATCSPMYLAAAATSSDGCRVLAGLEKPVSFGQKIGHIIGCPARLICRQPPASVASLVAHHTPVRAPAAAAGASGRPPARSSRRWCRRSCSARPPAATRTGPARSPLPPPPSMRASSDRSM